VCDILADSGRFWSETYFDDSIAIAVRMSNMAVSNID